MLCIESTINLKIELDETISNETLDLFKQKYYELLNQYNEELIQITRECNISVFEDEEILSESKEITIIKRQNTMRRTNSKS